MNEVKGFPIIEILWRSNRIEIYELSYGYLAHMYRPDLGVLDTRYTDHFPSILEIILNYKEFYR